MKMETQEPTPAPRKPKLPLIIGGIVALVLLLAGAAFVGGRLLNGKGLPGISLGGPGVSLGGDGKNVKIDLGDIVPAKELPQTPADVSGLFDHRQDNSIFIGTGRVTMAVRKDPTTGKVETSSNHDGPTVEVVITTQTKIYKDVTMNQFSGPPPEGQKIQQVVEQGSLDEVGQSSMMTIWGRKTGDRFIADVLVYTPPAFITK
jgi:hypothetical protein